MPLSSLLTGGCQQGWRRVSLAPVVGAAATQEDTMSNPFTYAELHTQDPTAAKTFYSELFAWKMSDHENPKGMYTEIDLGEGFPAGLLQAATKAGGSHW